MKALLALPVALSVSGCTLAPSAYCDFRPTEARCQERLNSTSAETFKGTCAAANGVAGDGLCPTKDQVGGCALGGEGDGSKLNDWYYPPETQASVVQRCTAGGNMFLDP